MRIWIIQVWQRIFQLHKNLSKSSFMRNHHSILSSLDLSFPWHWKKKKNWHYYQNWHDMHLYVYIQSKNPTNGFWTNFLPLKLKMEALHNWSILAQEFFTVFQCALAWFVWKFWRIIVRWNSAFQILAFFSFYILKGILEEFKIFNFILKMQRIKLFQKLLDKSWEGRHQWQTSQK